jgi:hypothetical protein
VVFIFSQTIAEVLPFVVSGIPWAQPQVMKYGGFVFIALVFWLFLSTRFPAGAESDSRSEGHSSCWTPSGASRGRLFLGTTKPQPRSPLISPSEKMDLV